MTRTVRHCENCGVEIDPIEKLPGDFIVCGSRECARAETQVYRERDADARERAEADNYDAYR
jgi:hypothetical protein